MIEYFGYLSSIIIAISITIKGGFYFRVLNLIGSVCFIIYALSIGSLPVALINVYAVGINIFYLFKLKKK